MNKYKHYKSKLNEIDEHTVENVFKKNILKINNIKNQLLKIIKPTNIEIKNLEIIKKEIINLIDKIIYNLKLENNINIYPICVGSSCRGTWLKNSYDIDIFITFPEKIQKEKMFELSRLIFSELIKYSDSWEDRHAEHQYIHITYKKYEIDVVPCFRVMNSNKIISSVDRTPFHS